MNKGDKINLIIQGGPYFDAGAKAELIKLCLDEDLVLKFKQGFIHEIV